ncbi:uncharacterized protein J3R85_015199 [Psidium guajava]|nr:uncharacterized protein J3R85_015199 [Psidium guajava]
MINLTRYAEARHATLKHDIWVYVRTNPASNLQKSVRDLLDARITI